MKLKVMAAVLLLAGTVYVNASPAKVWCLNAQLGGGLGLSAGAGNQAGLPYTQNVFVPAGQSVVRMTGTITVKAPGAVLVSVFAENVPIWRGEFEVKKKATWDPNGYEFPSDWEPKTWVIDVAFPETWMMSGLLYVDYQEVNTWIYPYLDGQFWEYQLTFYGK